MINEWVFTFGYNQPNAGHFVRIEGTYEEARQEMFRRYGDKWGFQYSIEEWKCWEKKCIDEHLEYLLETELL